MSSPFQAANCASLPFKPKLTALTHAQTSKADGAYLHVKVVSGPGQANIGEGQGRSPQAAAVAADDTAESLRRRACSKPTPPRVRRPRSWGRGRWSRRCSRNPLTGPAYLVSHGVGAVPDARDGPAGRRDRRSTWKGRRTSQAASPRARSDRSPTRRSARSTWCCRSGPHSVFAVNLPPRAKRRPVRADAEDADGDHRPERRAGQTDHRIGITGCPPARPRHRQAEARSGFVARAAGACSSWGCCC